MAPYMRSAFLNREERAGANGAERHASDVVTLLFGRRSVLVTHDITLTGNGNACRCAESMYGPVTRPCDW